MGDVSEYRGLLVAVSFLGVLALSISFIPSNFATIEYGRLLDAEQYEGFEAIDMQSFAETWNSSIDGGILYYMMYRQDFTIGANDFSLMSNYEAPTYPTGLLQMLHTHYWWIIPLYQQVMTWFDSDGLDCGTAITGEMLDDRYEDAPLEFKVKCTDVYIKVFFNFNTTTYTSPTDAWASDDLWVLVGINFDQAQTGFNAWAIIGMLLFFSLPEIHWVINALIAIPLWVCIVYVSYILILRAIGAVFGGGGA